ncbi:DNA cytosine methyltransferase [Amycolatopsis sp. NPDC054798]
MLLAYYSNGPARPDSEPNGTLTTKDRYALVGDTAAAVKQCTFRMLAPHEIAAGMGFAKDYQVKGSNRDRVRGYGNAVNPPAAETLVSALVETISGEDICANR